MHVCCECMIDMFCVQCLYCSEDVDVDALHGNSCFKTAKLIFYEMLHIHIVFKQMKCLFFYNVYQYWHDQAEGVICRLQVAGCRLQVAGCRLQVGGAGAGCRLIIIIIIAGITTNLREYKHLVYTTQVNSAFRALWLVNSEVISKYYSPPSSRRERF